MIIPLRYRKRGVKKCVNQLKQTLWEIAAALEVEETLAMLRRESPDLMHDLMEEEWEIATEVFRENSQQ